MNKKIYGITVATPLNPKNVNPEVPEEQIASSVAAYMDENPITPSGIGARPDTWMPTAEEVGARPDTWMPSASDVGARPDTWTPTASEIGATPESHATDKTNPHGVTAEQVGARPDTWLPTIEEIGAAPAGYGLGTIIGTIPAYSMATLKFSDAKQHALISVRGIGGIAYSTFLFTGYGPGGANRVRVKRIHGDENILYGITPQGDSPGLTIWNHTANPLDVNVISMIGGRPSMTAGSDGGATEVPYAWENPPMAAGVEYLTTECWNGKAVYTKLVDFGAFNGNTPKDFSVGTTADTGVPFRWNGVATNPDGIPYQIPSHKINAGMYFYEYGDVTYIYFSVQPQSFGDITMYGKLQIWYTKD